MLKSPVNPADGRPAGRWRWGRFWLLGAAVALLALVAVACEEEEAPPEETPAVETPVARTPEAKGPLKIGVLAPYTGGLANFGPQFENAIKLAANHVNDAGGVLGQPVQVVSGDESDNPEAAVAEANRLVDIEGVHAIVGAAGSGRTLPVAESVTGPKRILQISPSSTSPALTKAKDNDFLFRTSISDAAQGLVLAKLVEELGYTKVCTMFVNNPYGQGLSENFAAAFTGEVTAQVPHAESGTTFASELNQCTAGEPEALVAISYPQGQADVYLKEALEGGIIDKFVFVDGTKDGAMFSTLGWDKFDGMKGTAPSALETEQGQLFDDLYREEYGRGYDVPFVRESYDAAVVIALAAEAAGSTDPSAIRDALRDVANAPGDVFGPGPEGIQGALEAIRAGKDIDYQGASGSVEFDENGDILVGAIEVWRIDAAAGLANPDDPSKGLVTEKTFKVDLEAGTVEEITGGAYRLDPALREAQPLVRWMLAPVLSRFWALRT